MFEDEKCKGCKGSEYFCLMPLKIEDVECPCYTCLVKGVCVDACQLYNDYLELASDLSSGKMRIATYQKFVRKDYLVDIGEVTKHLTMIGKQTGWSNIE